MLTSRCAADKRTDRHNNLAALADDLTDIFLTATDFNGRAFIGFGRFNADFFRIVNQGLDHIFDKSFEIADAAGKGLTVIVLTHASLVGLWKACPDDEAVRAIFAEFPGTVKLVLNGHHHTDRFNIRDGIAYFDVNTVHNGFWKPHPEHHYTEDQTFSYTPYENGVRGETETRSLRSLRQAKNTWFFTEPTSAVVTLEETAEGLSIRIDGCETAWEYGVTPPTNSEAVYPGIRSRSVTI